MSHQRMVYLIDRDLETRRSLSLHLASLGAEAWPFASGSEFLEIASHLTPACILLDMDMPGTSGLDVMAELARRGIEWPVVAMSGCRDIGPAVEAMKRGAIDFLEKPVDMTVLAGALVPALEALARMVEAQEARRAAQERIARLTAREVDISLALFSGQANKAVAHDFGISVRTVEMHRAHIMAKLGVRSLAEAAVIATQAGLDLAPLLPQPAQDYPGSGAPRGGRPGPASAPVFRFMPRSAL
ncbi:MAG: response regulator transcription factor [Allosphingosinicella sp.]